MKVKFKKYCSVTVDYFNPIVNFSPDEIADLDEEIAKGLISNNNAELLSDSKVVKQDYETKVLKRKYTKKKVCIA